MSISNVQSRVHSSLFSILEIGTTGFAPASTRADAIHAPKRSAREEILAEVGYSPTSHGFAWRMELVGTWKERWKWQGQQIEKRQEREMKDKKDLPKNAKKGQGDNRLEFPSYDAMPVSLGSNSSSSALSPSSECTSCYEPGSYNPYRPEGCGGRSNSKRSPDEPLAPVTGFAKERDAAAPKARKAPGKRSTSDPMQKLDD